MEFTAARYCSVPFPSYAYRPGRNPHPTADPDGHSHRPPGTPAPPVEPVAAEGWQGSADYLYGCDLYNHAYWWEAHEAWEGLWQSTDKSGVQGRFLKGLIQVSACALKVADANTRGADKLLHKSRGHLSAILEVTSGQYFMGLDVARWLDAVDAYYADVLCEPGTPAHDPRRYPYILLQEEPR